MRSEQSSRVHSLSAYHAILDAISAERSFINIRSANPQTGLQIIENISNKNTVCGHDKSSHFQKNPPAIDIPAKPFQLRTTLQLRGGRMEKGVRDSPRAGAHRRLTEMPPGISGTVNKKWQLILRRSAYQIGCQFYDLGTVVTLSTMIPLIIDVPLVALDSTGRRNRGVLIEFLVKT
jgi:hypothetical protein